MLRLVSLFITWGSAPHVNHPTNIQNREKTHTETISKNFATFFLLFFYSGCNIWSFWSPDSKSTSKKLHIADWKCVETWSVARKLQLLCVLLFDHGVSSTLFASFLLWKNDLVFSNVLPRNKVRERARQLQGAARIHPGGMRSKSKRKANDSPPKKNEHVQASAGLNRVSWYLRCSCLSLCMCVFTPRKRHSHVCV